MKTKLIISGCMAVLVLALFTSCEDSLFDRKGDTLGILPERFKIDIPASLSSDNTKSAELKSSSMDTVNGNFIYWHLNTFIAVGEGAADIVEAAIWYIGTFNIENVISLSYTSEDDDRVKNLEVVANAEYSGRTWQYALTVTDAESENNDDGGKGMQIFWNNDPIEGIAIFKPYNLNRSEYDNSPDAICSIEYSEQGTTNYEAYMIVEIAGLHISETYPLALETLKMFVGKNGDNIDVYGNSDHPNARFNTFDNTKGYNWAFVASGNDTKNIAVAEVGLPYSDSDISGRTEILEDNSIKTVLTREMTNYVVAYFASLGITLQPEEISQFLLPYLKNAEAPGYFNQNGFVKGGTAPSDDYNDLVGRIGTLVPYNPSEISNLTIEFGN